MKKVRGMPITGATPEYSKKAPFVPNAKDTSADVQTMIAEAPTPFKNKKTAPNLSAPGAAPGGVSVLEPKIASGLKSNNAPKNPSGDAVGYAKLPDQSKQIGGRNSFPPPRRIAGDNSRGYPKKGNAKFYGE